MFYKYYVIISVLSKSKPKVAKISLINKGKYIMKNFIYNEMMVHVALCTHKNPENVLIIGDDNDKFAVEVKKHDSIRFDVIKADKDALRAVDDSKYNVIISELQNDAAVIAHYNRVLKDDGLLVINIPSLDEVQDTKNIMEIVGKYTKIVMPFDIGEAKHALLASKEYHPTADIILHRADMLDNLDYYNCDVHPSAFAMGNYIRKEYLGIIKN